MASGREEKMQHPTFCCMSVLQLLELVFVQVAGSFATTGFAILKSSILASPLRPVALASMFILYVGLVFSCASRNIKPDLSPSPAFPDAAKPCIC